MPIQVRKPLKEEYNSIIQIINEAFSVASLPIALDFFDDSKINCLVAVENDEILGTGTLHIIQKSNRQMGLIEDVVVAANQQGKGIGKKIINELVQLAEKIGCYKTILNSSELNQLFYEKQGFSKEQVQMTIRH